MKKTPEHIDRVKGASSVHPASRREGEGAASSERIVDVKEVALGAEVSWRVNIYHPLNVLCWRKQADVFSASPSANECSAMDRWLDLEKFLYYLLPAVRKAVVGRSNILCDERIFAHSTRESQHISMHASKPKNTRTHK